MLNLINPPRHNNIKGNFIAFFLDEKTKRIYRQSYLERLSRLKRKK